MAARDNGAYDDPAHPPILAPTPSFQWFGRRSLSRCRVGSVPRRRPLTLLAGVAGEPSPKSMHAKPMERRTQVHANFLQDPLIAVFNVFKPLRPPHVTGANSRAGTAASQSGSFRC